MESMFVDIFKSSPILGLMAIMWFYQRKDYNKLVEDTREESRERELESKNREEKMQNTINKNQEIINNNQDIINKNQEIISDLADKFDVMEEIKKDVTDIKNKLDK